MIRYNRTRVHLISDTHIGDGSMRDEYRIGTRHYEKLKSYLHNLNIMFENPELVDGKYEIHILVLLGDVINGEYGHRECYKSDGFKLIQEFQRLWTSRTYYVIGNHDNKAIDYSDRLNWPYSMMGDWLKIECCDVKFVLSHGHRYDPLCDSMSLIGFSGSWASNFAAKMLSPSDEDRARGVADDKDLTWSEDLEITTAEDSTEGFSASDVTLMSAALKGANRLVPDFTGVVCGHTHQRPCDLIGNTHRYINTGTFAKYGHQIIDIPHIICDSTVVMYHGQK